MRGKLIRFDGVKLDVLRDLYLNFVPPKLLGKIFGVSHRTIRRKLVKNNIELIGRSEALKQAWKDGRKKYNPDGIRRGPESSNWKGGKIIDGHGYIKIKMPEHPLANSDGYILEHRLVWYKNHPDTPKNYFVHHLNGIRDDNRIENLVAISRKDHSTWTLIKEYQKRIRELEGDKISNPQ